MRFVSQAGVSAALGKLPEPLRRRAASPAIRRLVRFAPAAVLALAATQFTYFLCASVWHLTGRVSGAVGWLAGVAVSYGVSRWAWERRGRPQLLRETLPFLAVSLLVTGPVLTEASHVGYVMAGNLRLHGAEFSVFVQGIYLAANALTFMLRFLIFHFILFADRRASLAALVAKARPLLPELARFTVVGLCTVLVASVMVRLLHRPAGAALLSWRAAVLLAAIAMSFAGNRYWTFRHRQRTTVRRESIQYLLLYSGGLLIQLACVACTTRLLSQHSALVLGVALALGFRYWSCRTWVWRAQAAPAPAI